MANVTSLKSVMGLIRKEFRLQGAWLDDDDGGHGLNRQRAKSCTCVTEHSS